MNKIEIEIPEGKEADIHHQSDGTVLVLFKNKEHWRDITDLYNAIRYLRNNDLCPDLVTEYYNALAGSYSGTIAKYRIVIAALTNNEERNLTIGERWYPVVQFCKPDKEKNCYGSEIIGSIESEGQKFTVVGGAAIRRTPAGLGNFYSYDAVSNSGTTVGFRSVSRREIAEHISKYFGRLLFEVHYGGVNCDWKWVN